MKSNIIIPFKFPDENGRQITIQESCWIDGNPYFTRRAIGEFLEYSDPQRAIKKIIKRNPQLDNPKWSVVVNLTITDDYTIRHPGTKLTPEYPSENQDSTTLKLRVVEGKKTSSRTRTIKTRVYDPIGFQMIVFESRQPKAMAFKEAVARLASAYMKGEIVPYSEHYQCACHKRQVAANRFEEIKSLPFGEKTKALDDMAKDLGMTRSAIQNWQTQYTHDNTLDDPRRAARRKRVSSEDMPRWRQIKRLALKGYPAAVVADIMGVDTSTVYKSLRKANRKDGFRPI